MEGSGKGMTYGEENPRVRNKVMQGSEKAA